MTHIKANEKFFNIVITINLYIKTLLFEKKNLLMQISTIQNCKLKNFIYITTYARLATCFFEKNSWRKTQWRFK